MKGWGGILRTPHGTNTNCSEDKRNDPWEQWKLSQNGNSSGVKISKPVNLSIKKGVSSL